MICEFGYTLKLRETGTALPWRLRMMLTIRHFEHWLIMTSGAPVGKSRAHLVGAASAIGDWTNIKNTSPAINSGPEAERALKTTFTGAVPLY